MQPRPTVYKTGLPPLTELEWKVYRAHVGWKMSTPEIEKATGLNWNEINGYAVMSSLNDKGYWWYEKGNMTWALVDEDYEDE